jgi:hypothetical protein
MKEFKQLSIKGKRDEEISVTHLDDTKNLHIMIRQYGELLSCELQTNKVHRLINKLNQWLKFKQERKGD